MKIKEIPVVTTDITYDKIVKGEGAVWKYVDMQQK
jgi:hypothetical protein